MDNPQRDPYILVTQFNFDDMHLPVGDRFQLESLADLGQFHYGALLGFSEGQRAGKHTLRRWAAHAL